MEDLKKLENKLIDGLEKIRSKENKTANDYQDYEEIQSMLRKVHSVMYWIKEYLK